MTIKNKTILIVPALLFALGSCCGSGKHKKNHNDATDSVAVINHEPASKRRYQDYPVLDSIFETYKTGEWTECTWNYIRVFKGKMNVYDAQEDYFDIKGKKIGTCNYNVGLISPVCKEATACKVVWRVSPNIWGLPGVDLSEK